MHYKEIIGRNRKILVLILSGLFVAVLFSGSIFLFRAVTKNEKIGWITDIHAGNLKIRTMHKGSLDEDTLYPKKYKEYLNIVIDKMKKDGVDTIVATGDNTNEINVKKAQELKKIEEGKNIKIVWIRGNHDFDLDQNKNIMPYLGVEDSNYVYDTKNVRIIALDINFNGPKFSEENLKWLEEKLSETNLPVIIAMHMPIVAYKSSSIYPEFKELGDVINSSGKVKYVISGHLHREYQTNIGEIVYKTGYPLTSKDHLGSYYEFEFDNIYKKYLCEKIGKIHIFQSLLAC